MEATRTGFSSASELGVPAAPPRCLLSSCGYAKFTQPVASMAGSILIPPEVKIHTWKQCAQGAALLSANVTRIDVTGHVLLFQDASEFLH